MPPKPVSQSEADAEFYNIDFSYQTQLRLAAGHSPAQIQSKFTRWRFPSTLFCRKTKFPFYELLYVLHFVLPLLKKTFLIMLLSCWWLLHRWLLYPNGELNLRRTLDPWINIKKNNNNNNNTYCCVKYSLFFFTSSAIWCFFKTILAICMICFWQNLGVGLFVYKPLLCCVINPFLFSSFFQIRILLHAR